MIKRWWCKLWGHKVITEVHEYGVLMGRTTRYHNHICPRCGNPTSGDA